MHNMIYSLICFSLLVNCLSSYLSAQDLPKSGRLAGSASAGAGQIGFDSDWGGVDLMGQDSPPVSASVVRRSPHEWLVKVFNNTKDQFRTQLQVVQKSKGRQVKSDTLSLTLNAGQSIERRIPAHGLSENAEVNLVKWNKTPRKMTKDEIEEAISKKKSELDSLEAELKTED